jgi:hypothetical protein
VPRQCNAFAIGKEQLEALRNTKKIKEPMLTVEEKASIHNKAEIKGTGTILSFYEGIYRIQPADDLF